MSSRDGFVWTPSTGLQAGLPTPSKVDPPTRNLPGKKEIVDVIVIGAGYAGLVAARDLATKGNKVLLIEARDRIGGRTWHSNIDGFNYEMGGTWVHWHMPHIYREMSLYGLQDDWIITQVPGGKKDFCTLTMGSQKRDISHEEEMAIFSSTWGTFCNIDGTGLRKTLPYPLTRKSNGIEINQWDKLSCRDRINQIKDQFPDEHIKFLEAILIQMGGGPIENMAFTEAMRWYSLGSWTPTGLNDIGLTTRPRCGQSGLARKIFDHAVRSGNLAYSFNSPTQSIVEEHGVATVVLRDGTSFNARQVISTIPLNVLSDISFSPPLAPLKTEAFAIGQVNHCNKIHANIKGEDLVSWTSIATPGKGLVCGLADNLTPEGDTHLVFFGPTPGYNGGLQLCSDGIESVKNAVEHLLPENANPITRIVYHDWVSDEFSKGTWCYYPTNFATKYLDALREPHGRVHFAGADWSHGWRGWIDGAVEQGASVAMAVERELGASGSFESANTSTDDATPHIFAHL